MFLSKGEDTIQSHRRTNEQKVDPEYSQTPEYLFQNLHIYYYYFQEKLPKRKLEV